MIAFTDGPVPPDVAGALAALERRPGVAHLAVMPDVHLAEHVCVGVVLATRDRLYPDAVGSDVGCGVAALPLVGDVALDVEGAATVLDGWARAVPILAHDRDPPPFDALPGALGRRASRQLGTLGRGNHFLELQRADGGGLWVCVHTGSRGAGAEVQARWRARAGRTGLSVDEAGPWLTQVTRLRAWARESRRRVAEAAVAVLGELGLAPDWDGWIDGDHDHVQPEVHHGERLWVHRKGAIAAPDGALAVIPGSMGTFTVHVEGRGHAPALASASHGAGRAHSRGDARRRVDRRALLRETAGVWFDPAKADGLRAEAPSAYKPLERVLRAERELVRVVRTLRPLLVHKGG